jgi:hypothetical protein
MAAGDPRAADFLQQTYDLLMEYADRVGDEEMRCSFLENVSWHREIVALTWGGERSQPPIETPHRSRDVPAARLYSRSHARSHPL